MADTPLFLMAVSHRQSLIESHDFYVKQSHARLLSQFENMSEEADIAAEEWLDKNGGRFDPDYENFQDLCEVAFQEGIDFYSLLNDLKNSTYLNVVSGMYQEWDKQLRKWMVSEISQHIPNRASIEKCVWNADIGKIYDLFECLGWKVRKENFFEKLDVCRLLVNTHKHGEGGSFEKLKEHPEYFPNYTDLFAGLSFDGRRYDSITVNQQQIDEFSDSIRDFWYAVPNEIKCNENTSFPPWFKQAYEKD